MIVSIAIFTGLLASGKTTLLKSDGVHTRSCNTSCICANAAGPMSDGLHGKE